VESASHSRIKPGDLLLRPLCARARQPGPLAVGVQRRISQRSAEASQPLFQHMDLALDLVEAAPELTPLRDSRRLRARASVWHPVAVGVREVAGSPALTRSVTLALAAR